MTPSEQKELVRTFYRELIGARDIELAERLIAENYIQHNPLLKTGRVGVLEAIAYLKQFPTPPPGPSPIQRIFAEADLVVVHLLVAFGPSKQVVMDIFRTENGQLVEHWDAIQVVPATIDHPEHLVNGPTEVRSSELTSVNKKLIQSCYQAVWIERNLGSMEEWVHPDLTQHQAGIPHGREALAEHLAANDSPKDLQMHRVIAEGNFVLVQASGISQQVPTVLYDLFRLEAGLIVEQWQVHQAIPEHMAHENGMI
ncbi:MAG: nuclear transport factor 2 family protein [Bacteroidota bacterium]